MAEIKVNKSANKGQLFLLGANMALKAIAAGVGLTSWEKKFRDNTVKIADRIQETLVDNAKANKIRAEKIAEGIKSATELEAKTTEIKEKGKTAAYEEEQKGAITRHQEKNKREVVTEKTEHKISESVQQKVEDLGVAQLAHRQEIQQASYEAVEKKAQVRLQGVNKNLKTLSATNALQAQIQPIQSQVAETQGQVLKAAQEIASKAATICAKYSNALDVIHASEREEHQSVNEIKLASARQAFALSVLDAQTKLAIELADHKAELEKVKAKAFTGHDMKLESARTKGEIKTDSKITDKEIEIMGKIHACEAKQAIFIEKIREKVTVGELKELSRLMKNNLEATSYNKMQGKRMDNSEAVSHEMVEGVSKGAKTLVHEAKSEINMRETAHSAHLSRNVLQAQSFERTQERQAISDAQVVGHVESGAANQGHARHARERILSLDLMSNKRNGEKTGFEEINEIQGKLNNLVVGDLKDMMNTISKKLAPALPEVGEENNKSDTPSFRMR